MTQYELIEKMCAEMSDEAAEIMLKIARAMSNSPLGAGDINVIKAQRFLEERFRGNQ